ncbi:MAG: S9 family peptidase [Gammaproteobacteria bacterium]|nr:S9 family peptidase [Gammaproteobacteria bacterium]MDH4315464.1 S9 family peptidase [Gammaproteobacteria bacterium]MDH5214277.1 S9 family peptidase [Gammaproteobacteria bacterium]MDH5501069.1 S9 family peptidase [Gammaproteobacteria bacterium]
MRKIAFLPLFLLIFVACSKEPATVPAPEKKPVTLEIHGDTRTDDYYWLRERENPEVIAYLEAENAYMEKALAPFKGLQSILYDEMKARIRQDEFSAPYKRGDYFYYYRYVEGGEYPIYARKRGSMDADEELMLDVNKLAGDADYFAVSGFSVSPDDRIAAYGVDDQGRRFYDIYFLDLETGELLADRIDDTTANFHWANDSRTILYGKQHPDTLRSYRVFRHTLGSGDDSLVYEEPDATNYLSVSKSLSSEYFYLTSSQTLSTEVRYLSANSPQNSAKVFLPRESLHEYFVSDGADRFYILSNNNATNFRLMEAPLGDTSKASWNEVVAHRDNALIENFKVFRNYLVITIVENGLTQMEIIDRETGATKRIDFGEEVYTAYSDVNEEFDTEWFRYTYESMTTPESTYDINLKSDEHKLIKEQPVEGDFDRSNYRTERLFATARDGTRVPVSIVYRKGMEKNGRNPLLQYAYGSYGSSTDPSFSSDRLSLLDRGFIFAIAHIRGGSEMGREWYYDGRQLNKKNTFTDFIDVSKYLIEQGYTSPDHLYAYGGSAGGLLMGAVLNMAPELYNGVMAAVPFVDVITTMLDADIPLTSGEWDEWGNPNDREYYDYMKSYSPYDNVRKMEYPNLLVTTGLHDSQVQYWEPAKWVAKLREYKTDDNMLALKTDMSAGHSGKTGRFRRIEDTSLYYAFFMGLEGIRE